MIDIGKVSSAVASKNLTLKDGTKKQAKPVSENTPRKKKKKSKYNEDDDAHHIDEFV